MQERLKMLRKMLKMSQKEFAKKLGVGQSTLAMMEVSKREIPDRYIKTICAIFGVSEAWFRTGEGDMFRREDASLLDCVAQEYHLTPLERAILSSFLGLDSRNRATVMGYVSRLVEEYTKPSQQEPVLLPAELRLAELERQNQKLAARLEALEQEEDTLPGTSFSFGPSAIVTYDKKKTEEPENSGKSMRRSCSDQVRRFFWVI